MTNLNYQLIKLNWWLSDERNIHIFIFIVIIFATLSAHVTHSKYSRMQNTRLGVSGLKNGDSRKPVAREQRVALRMDRD